MDKYKKLVSNTLIFAVGSFSSKILFVILTPVYTWVLNPAEMGVTDLTTQIGNLLLPVVGMGIIEAIVRFGLDRNSKKSDVFTTGLVVIMVGWGTLMLVQPLVTPHLGPLLESMHLGKDFLEKNLLLIDAFVLTSCLRSLCNQFVRAKGMVKLYAVNGILSAVFTMGAVWVFLVMLRWGVAGYILSIICADALSVLFLTVTARLPKFVRFRGLNLNTSKGMLKYSIPMIPNTIFWWLTNISSRFILAYFMGQSANGLFSTANKVPALIIMVSSMFMDAWQMSAVTEERTRARFFSKVFRAYTAAMFTVASGIILFTRVLMKMLTFTSDEYAEAWRGVPFLVIATVFTCLVNFMGSVYMVEKKSMHSLATAALGAVCNVGFSFLLIPRMGINGAGVAMLLSYIIVFIVRAIDSRRYIKIRWSGLRMVVNTLVLLAQAVIIIKEAPLWVLWEALLTALMLLMNYQALLESAMKIIPARFLPKRNINKKS